MQLKEFINYRVEVVRPDDSLQQAAQKMKDLDVGSMPVCKGLHLVGMLTDRDITIRATAKGQNPTTTAVRDVMTPEVLYCFETHEVQEAARIMRENQVRRLFVLNENEELVGVTSLGELTTATGDHALAGETLERISEEPGPRRDAQVHEPAGGEEKNAVDQSSETSVSGLFHDRETVRSAVRELKDAGFTNHLISIAAGDEAEQNSLIQETQTAAVPVEIVPNLPSLSPGTILILVDANDRPAEALTILGRHSAVTGGVRTQE